jgi:hypothetical protein
LTCSIASIKGVVPAEHLHAAIDALRTRFDIPVINRKE